MEQPDLCKSCGGKCCTDPFFTTEEYIRLVTVIGNAKVMEHEPRDVVGGWKFKPGPCPGLTENGCALLYKDRPQMCRIYPFLIIPTKEGRNILALALRTCPAWKEYGDQYWDTVRELAREGITIG